MYARRIPCFWLLFSLLICSAALSVVEHRTSTPPPASVLRLGTINGPPVLSSHGDTAWIQVHTDSTHCPGDPMLGHGGEAAGGPGPLETWCFEGGPGDTCGTNPPWDTNCFNHIDVREHPSPMNINYWHIATYCADEHPYCGSYCLWCGSDSLWTDGKPVDCGTWTGNYPGYGNSWNCIVQLTLPDTFSVANGCTLFFDPRYDTECKYDYFYVDCHNGTEWITLATFNASSNNPGDPCGDPGYPNPDYWGNTNEGQPNSAGWQERTSPGEPTFYRVLTPDTLVVTSGPRFRWRFISDGAWSDQDGGGDTDGGAFIDNVWVRGDNDQYAENFESGILDTNFWSLPDPDGLMDAWHIVHDPDPLYEGGDGGDRNSCTQDSSFVFRGRPEQGYPSGASWRSGWYYRLVSPRIPIQNSGCLVQYDIYCMTLDYTCDYGYTGWRFYSTSQDRWCPWMRSPNSLAYSWCSQFFWWFDLEEVITYYYSSDADSVQFCWELLDTSSPGDFCRNKHKSTDFHVDNVSIGFYDAASTIFKARNIDLLHDTFHDDLCGYNSHFDAHDPDSVNRYSGPPYDDVPLPKEKQLYLDVIDMDGVANVALHGSIDGGENWTPVSMTMALPYKPENPSLGGEYYGTVCPDDFGLDTWETGTEVWYYVKAVDSLSNEEYFPQRADPDHPGHTGESDDYLTFSILPMYPDEYVGPRILLVDGCGDESYDWAPCLGSLDQYHQVEDIYEQVLTDAGYCYDKYDINGAGSVVRIEPISYHHYDAIVWFTGPDHGYYQFSIEPETTMVDYLNAGGKIVFCGDRLAFYLMECPPGYVCAEDFLSDVLCVEYLEEMPMAFDYPYVYAVAEESVNVFGTPVEIGLDTLLIYRECPDLREMSYFQTSSPAESCASQPIMYIANPTAGEPDEVIYSEYGGGGQCVLVNFDLSGSVNHTRGYCDGQTPELSPDFTPGTYDGRVELMRVILEDLFGLPSSGGGMADVVEPRVDYKWALHQNMPNPCTGGTEIRYEVASSARVSLRVYNALGQVVRVLEKGRRDPGIHRVWWDGCNESDELVSSGVYFYKIEAGGFIATRKMLVIK